MAQIAGQAVEYELWVLAYGLVNAMQAVIIGAIVHDNASEVFV